MSKKKPNESFMSSPSAKSKTGKTSKMLSPQGASLTEYGQGEVVSDTSNSPLAEVYGTEEFRNEWANDVRFHVARNLLHLRRYRGLSQTELAALVGTSQSAVARTESGQENITMDTLERYMTRLRGRLHVSIVPQEYASYPICPWWESTSTYTVGGSWQWAAVGFRQTPHADVLMLGFVRPAGTNPGGLLSA